MGRKEAAIAEGRRAVELKPESRDAVDGPLMNGYLALIYTRVGERDLALSLLERLLHTPHATDSAQYSVSLQDLRIALGMGSVAQRSTIRKDDRVEWCD